MGKNTDAGVPWADRYDPEVPLNLDYPRVPVHQLFSKTVADYPGKPALSFFGQSLTYGQLGDYAHRLAAGLKNTGIEPGDRVALLLPNCPQYVMCFYALLSVGAVVVPLNPLNTETELLHIVRDGGVRAAIGLDLLAGRLEAVRDRCREAGERKLLEHTFYTSLREFMPPLLKILYPLKQKLSPEAKQRLGDGGKFAHLLSGTPSPSAGEVPAPDVRRDTAVLIYTGGTTGKPKGVMLSHYALVVNATHCAAWVRMSREDRLLAVLPVFHGFGMSVCMNATVVTGASVILLPRYSPEEVLKACHCHQPTLFAGVPTMYVGLINHPKLKRYNLSSLRGCFSGAAALAPEVKKRFEELTGARLLEGYGLTEAVTAKSVNPYRGVNKTGSIGIPFPDTVMRILNPAEPGNSLPPGEVGELILQSPDIMLGYYNRPEETAAAIRDGWLYTGDLGYMDEDGYFYIVDRKKDLIITGGFNVYPREVEDVLYSHPAVREACVIGVPDHFRGEMVKAFVTLKEGQSATPEDIISFCGRHLMPYKVPRQVEIRPDLPKTAIGKVLKRALREMEATGDKQATKA
ncbi:MAG: long-chain fatty acid--CoA ligase [Firmicutes bacterium]|nr:long-chain fatty acid--CoA ligase [Bacillota bacterium]